MGKNKVFYGLSNLKVALMKSTSAPGAPAYEKPVAIPGAVSFSPSPDSSETKTYADNTVYYVSNISNGYTADLETMRFSDEMLAAMLGWLIDSNGALIETPVGEVTPFAIMGQIEGDARGRKFVYLYCTAGTPTFEMKTTSGSNEPSTQKLPITIAPYDLGVDMGKGITTATMIAVEYDSENPDSYNNFFDAVYIPPAATSAAGA